MHPTANRLISAFFSLCMVFLATGPARAGDVFTVARVPVDATASSATEARAIALANGQTAALERLLKRLTLPQDWPLLPQASAFEMQSLVRGFQVANEKTSGVRYLADLTVSFNPPAVRSLLAQRSIAFSESQAKPALLLALYDGPSGLVLWEDDNPWRAAWAAQDLANSLTPLTLPLGDIEDLSLVTADAAASGNLEALSALASRYGADQVYVSRATPDGAGGLGIVTTRYGAANSDIFSRQVSAQGDAAQTARSAAHDLLNEFALSWKRETTVKQGDQSILSATVAFANAAEWETIRRRLRSVPLIKKMLIVGISAGGAQIELDYVGSVDNLGLNLAQQNLQLMDQAGFWSISLRQ